MTATSTKRSSKIAEQRPNVENNPHALPAWLEPIREAGQVYRSQLDGRIASYSFTKGRRKRLERMKVLATELRALLKEDDFAIVGTFSEGMANLLDESDGSSVLKDVVDSISKELSENPIVRGRPPKEDRRHFWTICALCYEKGTGRPAATSKDPITDRIFGRFVDFIQQAHLILAPKDEQPTPAMIDEFVDWFKANRSGDKIRIEEAFLALRHNGR